jgi:hypothetical protein
MWVLLRTVLLLPLVLAIAVLVLLAIGLRVACNNSMRERPCAAL